MHCKGMGSHDRAPFEFTQTPPKKQQYPDKQRPMRCDWPSTTPYEERVSIPTSTYCRLLLSRGGPCDINFRRALHSPVAARAVRLPVCCHFRRVLIAYPTIAGISSRVRPPSATGMRGST